MIAVIDYGAGNVFNVLKACSFLGIDAELTADQNKILNSDGIILPGVGAFCTAMKALKEKKLITVIKKAVEKKIPLLGICLGMQMLFDSSTEYGVTGGLSLIPGKVVHLPDNELAVPQVGWNRNYCRQGRSIFSNVSGQYTYFVHSYYVQCDPQYIISSVNYGVEVPAIVRKGRVYGMQFHPEKSGKAGLKLLQEFFEEVNNK